MNFEELNREAASYKDTSGWVFYKDDKVYRKISPQYYENHYLPLKEKGFYKKVIEMDYLIPFTEEVIDGQLYLVSDKIDPITYPYEWGTEQLRDMAIFHLDFLQYCLDHDVMIKDANAFNLQFRGRELLFIDLLSFEIIHGDYSWKAYQQFCENYVAPLVLSYYQKRNANKQFIHRLEGIPIKTAVNQLPFKATFNGLAFYHLIAQSKFKKTGLKSAPSSISKKRTLQIIRHLTIGIQDLKLGKLDSSWVDYTENLPYNLAEQEAKEEFVKNCLISNESYLRILDIGANHSEYVTQIYPNTANIILIDNDLGVVNHLYKKLKNHAAIILDVDITQPSPAIGLNLKERGSFLTRIKPDIIIALALIHHLFHNRNIPMERLMSIFTDYRCDLLIEFVDATDEKFQQIANPENRHPYSQELFEQVFSRSYQLLAKQEIIKGKRYLYHYSFKLS